MARMSGWGRAAARSAVLLTLGGAAALLSAASVAQAATTAAKLPSATSATVAADDARLAAQRKQFKRAIKQLNAGKTQEFLRLERGLQDYALAPYLRYAWLSDRLRTTPSAELSAFIKAYPDSPLSGRLRTAWLKVLAKQRRWKQFLRVYNTGGRQSATLQCQKAVAEIAVGKSAKFSPALIKDIEKLWLYGGSRPDACDPVFAAWRKKGLLTDPLVWSRVELAMAKGKTSLALYLRRFFKDSSQARWVERWVQVYKAPARTLEKARWSDSGNARTVVADGVRRVARRDAAQAHALWEKQTTAYAFDAAQRSAMDAYIARRAALQQLPQARAWLAAVANPEPEITIWSLRMALIDGDWAGVSAAYQALDAEHQAKDQWRYWQARALQARGEPDATELFAEVAAGRGYHSFMAADRIGVPYNFGAVPLQAKAADIDRMAERPALQRALELYRLQRYWEARGEWAAAIRGLGPAQLRAAAQLAAEAGWDDRAIITLARSRDWDVVNLRFPLRHQNPVFAEASRHGLDPSWVYGVIRQESAFVSDARSSAGARGLMQLMPATGKETAQALGKPLRKVSELNTPQRNIQIGSAYLKKVLDRNNGNMVLATASYNAGPNRVRRWLPEQTVEADIWLEAIPYNETRRYVKNVLAYAAIYDWRRGVSVTPLDQRMQAVQPLPN